MSDNKLITTTAEASDQPASRWAILWESAVARMRPLLPFAFFLIAAWLLHHEFKSIKAEDVAASLREIPVSAVLAAIALTAANYAVLVGYDWFGVRLVKHPLSFKQITIASLLSYAFSNSLGAVFGGTPVRVRLYSAWGMSRAELIRMLIYISLAFWMGLFLLSGILFLTSPFAIPDRFHLPLTSSQPIGGIMLVVVAGFFLACLAFRRPIHLFSVNIQPPPITIGLAQVAISATDFLLASAALYVLLPADANIGFFSFTSIFLLSIIVALASHVPGGIGVLELVLVTMLAPSAHGFVASLLVYRVVYYLLPLLIAVLAIAVSTARRHSGKLRTATSQAIGWTRIVGPRLIMGSVFLAGLLLLVSGSLPTADGRMEIVRRFLPLPVVEISHFLGSVVGALLLILARGLQRRIDVAWWLTVALLSFGIIFSLTKGFDYEEAALLTILLCGILPCRQFFYRQGDLFASAWTIGWFSGVGISLALVIWLLLFSFRHVDYSSDLWWEFTYHGDAPRSLRALCGAVVIVFLFLMVRLLRPSAVPPAIATKEELAEVTAIVETSQQTNANLALLGDKRFVFSQDRKAFVMFGCQGKSWIAMGDPVGPDESADDAAWQFREACDRAGVWPAFYQVAESSLARYIDMGMSMIKLGELARVPLSSFSLDGSSRKDLRRSKKKAAEAGLSFRIIDKSEIDPWLPKLKEISDQWLGDKSAGEKGFSLGYFDEDYLRNFDVAIVEQAGQPIAFANLWRSAELAELSIDLMRYRADAPHGVMEYLFVELMLYGHEQGYAWFDLGMAPLSGIATHRLAPVWNRISNVTYRHGERFYNFRGLRAYKEKFDPTWTPRYLACPGGVSTAPILADIATLISGGIRKLVHR